MSGMKDLFGDTLYEPQSFGTEPHKLHRRDSVETSVEAAYAVDTTKLETMVFRGIKTFGGGGCISDQVRKMFPHFSYSSITARFAALEEKQFIRRGPDKRRGDSGRNQLVMRAIMEK